MPSARSIALTALLTAAAALVPGTADAALNAYLKLKGQKQGEIKGGVIQKGREGMLRVLSLSHTIVSPRDPASGLPTGKRQHKPITIVVELDRAAPKLFTALVHNENLSSLQIRFFAPQKGTNAGAGGEVQNYTIELTNAQVAEIRTIKPADASAPDVLELSLTYQKIEWIWNEGAITGTDDWSGGAGKGL